MKDFTVDNGSGFINIEERTDGGIGVYVESSNSTMTVMLTKDDLEKLIEWITDYNCGHNEKL